MTAYYNEFEPYAAEWLRNLIKAGHIAPGDVDDRSILEVKPDDIRSYTQCHFFAGIGIWSYALRRAGWPDDRPVWTGSAPCQPFSAAGQRAGYDDARHLAPVWLDLIAERHPSTVFGEQVASADGRTWLAALRAEMEGLGYAVGAVDMCAAGIGAPHIRQRLWFGAQRLADAGSLGRERGRTGETGGRATRAAVERPRDAGGLGHHHHQGLEGQRSGHQAEGERIGTVRPVAETGELGGLADAGRDECGQERADGSGSGKGSGAQGLDERPGGGGAVCGLADAECDRRKMEIQHYERGGSKSRVWETNVSGSDGASNGTSPSHVDWRDADWLYCRDGKWRPVEPGSFPLAHGHPQRVGKLRAYGNAICPEVASEFIAAFMECRP